jgi:GST-like protein
VPFIFGVEGWSSLPNIKRLVDEINTHPAAERVNALATRHAYKSEMDDQARKAMFPHLHRQAKL